VSPAATGAASPWSIAQRPRDRSGECDPARRVGARVVDFIPLFAVYVATAASTGHSELEGRERLPVVLLPALYEIALVAWRGQTIGKMAVHIRVVAADGRPVTWSQSFVRWLAQGGLGVLAIYVSTVGVASVVWFFLTLAMLFFHGLGPHDHIARTKVVLDAGVNRS
jgi:uncharacterized RDD family membrane protein YckC